MEASGRHVNIGKLFKYDISLRPAEMSEFIGTIRKELKAKRFHVLDRGSRVNDKAGADVDGMLELCTFGHVGDGNMHLNILARRIRPELIFDYKKILDKVIFQEVSRRRGSISAEHGVGQEKVGVLFGYERDTHYRDRSVALNEGSSNVSVNRSFCVRSDAELQLMRAVKAALDPNGIMNPGKVIPEYLKPKN